MGVDHVFAIAVALFQLLGTDVAFEPFIGLEICVLNSHVLFQRVIPSEFFGAVFTFVIGAFDAKYFRVHGPHVLFFAPIGFRSELTMVTFDRPGLMAGFVAGKGSLILAAFPTKSAGETQS